MDTEDTPSPPRPAHNARLTLVTSVYYDSGDGPTDAIEHRHGRFLAGKEQLWRRRLRVGRHWRALDLGWYDDKPLEVGTIILALESVDGPGTEPHQLEVGLVPHAGDPRLLEAQPIPFAYLLPGSPTGDPLRINPVLPHHLRLRCLGGEAMVTIYILPH